jgi:hypothetical protein
LYWVTVVVAAAAVAAAAVAVMTGAQLQVWIYRQRYLAFVEASRHVAETGQGVILDRSVYSDKVFADVNLDDKNITEEGPVDIPPPPPCRFSPVHSCRFSRVCGMVAAPNRINFWLSLGRKCARFSKLILPNTCRARK